MTAWADAGAAARLFASDPHGFGGVVLRAAPGPVRDRWLALLPPDLALRKLPAGASDEALDGGLDLAATLASGRPVMRAGLLAQSHDGALIVAMAERLEPAIAGRLALALDTASPGRFGVIALDEGVDEERPPAALAERCAFQIDLSELSIRELDEEEQTPEAKSVTDAEAIEALTATAAALGIDSARAPLFALKAARALGLSEAALAAAVRLVLGPRATRLPAEAEEPAPEPPPGETSEPREGEALADRLVEAARAALPADVIAALAEGRAASRQRAGGQGAARKGKTRGRPAGVRAGDPGRGVRLSIIDTLRAAAPWQRVRGRTTRVLVRRTDFRVKRFVERAEATTIFVVDGSGSAALERLAEAKGAVELLLAQAYVKRTEVAVIAFRGKSAEILLPPTRSLARAKRALADMMGGGGTPLAAGIEAGRALAEAAVARGRTPFIVLMTDGRANVAIEGGGRAKAVEEAEAAARRIAMAGTAAVLIDIAARPAGEGATIAAAMRARYLALPFARAETLAAAIR